MRRSAAAERESRLRAARAREAREHAATVRDCRGRIGTARSPARLAAAVAAASRTRDEVAAERSQRTEALNRARTEVNELGARIGALTDSLHRDEVAKAQAALRIEQLEQQAPGAVRAGCGRSDRRIRTR